MSDIPLFPRKFIGGLAHGTEIDLPINAISWSIPYYGDDVALVDVTDPKPTATNLSIETYVRDDAGDFIYEPLANDKSKKWLTFKLTNAVSDMQLAQGGPDFLTFLHQELTEKFDKEMNSHIYTVSKKVGINLNIVKGQYDYILELRKIIDGMKKRENAYLIAENKKLRDLLAGMVREIEGVVP